MSILARIARSYDTLLKRKPVATNMITASVLCGAGDFLAQKLEKSFGIQSHGKTGYNHVRTVRMMTWGVVSGGMCSYWYPWLAHATVSLELAPWREVGFKLFFDQILFQPLCINAFFAVTSLLEGKTLDETRAKMQNKVLPSWMVATPIWSCLQLFNFRLTPVQYQPLVVYFGCLGHNTAMSVVSHAQDYGTPTEQVLHKQLAERNSELECDRETIADLEDKLRVMETHLTAVIQMLPEEERMKAHAQLQNTWDAYHAQVEAEELESSETSRDVMLME